MATRKEIAQNQKILYDDAVANNMFQAAVPTFNEFQKRLEGQGYQKMVYDNYKKHNVNGKGFNNLNEFRGAFGGSFYADENKIGVSGRAAAISASAQQTMNNAGRYNRLKQRKQKHQKDFGRVNLGTHKTPYGGDANNVVKDDFAYNPETGKAGAYVTSDNENVYTQNDAEQSQAQDVAYQNAVDTGDIPSVFDVRDKKGNYDLQENINKNGTYLTEEGAQKQFDKKLADAYARKKEIEAAIAEDHRLHGNPLLSYGASIGASNGRTAEQSDYSNKLATSLALVKQQIGALEAVKQYPTSSWGEDALKALDNTAFTAKTWDFGLTDFATMGQMERIKTKMDNNIPLSGSDKMLLKSKLGADAAAALEDEKMGNIYRWTKIAGQSLPFMADFFLTGGYGGITKGISRGALKFAAKRGMGKVSAAILKNTGIVAGDVIGSYAMAGTEQALKTGADIMQRHLGNLYQDEKGDYKFGTFDENGNLLHEGGESMGTALYKGLTSAMVENYTEKLFGHDYGIKKGAIAAMEKHGMNGTAQFFKNIGKSGWYTNSKKWMEKFGINGFAEEVMEEEIGIPLHAMLDGDNKFSDLGDLKQQLDIIGGMAISVGSMYAMGAGSRPVKGIYNRAQYYRFRNKVNVADSDAQNLMGDNWADIKDKIDNATNEQMGGVLADILRQRNTMNKEQINAAVNYGVNLMKMRGYNVAKTAEMNAKEITNEPTTPEEQHQTDIDNAYSEGHDADDADKHDIQIQQEDQMKTLAAALGISEQQLSAMSDEKLESLTGQNDKLDQAIYDYQLSSARYQGVVDDAQDKVDLAAHQAEQRVDMYTDQSRGSVRNATIKDSGGLEDYGVYIISGNIATHDDGSIDVSNSDDMILYYDPTTNSVEHADALMFAELGEELPADDVKAQAVADAKENAIKEVAGIIDGTVEVGSQFNVTDADGTEHIYEVLADYGDGTAAISIDGNVVENPYSFADLQQMKDLEDQNRLEAAKAEREQLESKRAEQQNQQTEETQPSFDFNQILNDDGNVVLVDVLDKDGNTKYPDSRLFLIRDAGAKAKVVELKSDGSLVPHAVNKEDVATISSMSLDEYKQAMDESSMIENNRGENNRGENRGEIEVEAPTIEGETAAPAIGVAAPESAEVPATEQTPAAPAITLEDGTIVPMLEDGNPDFSKLTAAQTAELYDSQFGEDADSIVSGYVSDAKKALDKASNMTVKGKTFVEQKAAKNAKEKAIADAQAAYESAIAIRDAYDERQLAKVEDTAEGRKELIEKARRKFARLKSAVKDDAEAVSQIYKETVGTLLHRLYDATGIDVTDTIPLTAEEYVASNLGAHSLNYEGTETSKGVKQETGLSREDFAKTQLLAADGKGTTIDNLVHSLWENRPSNLDSLDTQDIRNAMLSIITSGFKASEARNYIENLRIAQAENILEEQKKAAENAAFADEQKAESESQTETAPESEEKTGEENSNEENDEENEKINEQTNENINAPEVPEDATEENPLGAQLDQTDLPFSARDNGTQQTTAERDADVEKNKVDDVKVVDNIVGEKTRKAFERLAKMMGANIQWQYSDKLGNGWIQETKDADGNVHRTIFITLDSSITEGAQFIFGHEMTHQIKNLNPAAYNELTQLVLDTYGSDSFDKAVDETMQRYSGAGFSGRARDYYAEEVVADAVGEMIRDLNLAHTLAMKMSHPLLAAIHEILQKIKLAFFGTEYSDVTKNIIRSIEQAYVKTANGQVTNSETGEDVSFSLRQKPEPKKKGIGYKVFVLKDGKLYPPMVANPDGAATPVGVWLDADAAPIAGESKTGRPQVKQGGKGTQGGSGKLAYRPGWHLGVVPYAIQFNRKDAEGNKTLFPKNFVFAEVEYAADVDYQEEARQEGINPSGKYQHSLAGLKHLPTDGYYMYRTNPNPETDPWVITGAMKVNRILTRAEQADLVSKAGREPQQIQEGDIVTDDVVNSINQEIADAPKFSLKVYHGSGADFTEFDFDHMGEGAGSQAFGWGGYVTSSEEIGKSYVELTRKKPTYVYNGKEMSEDDLRSVLLDKVGIDNANILDDFLYNLEKYGVSEAKSILRKGDYAYFKDLLKGTYGSVRSGYQNKVDAAELILAPRNIRVKKYKGNLYEVDIPEDNGSNYIEFYEDATPEFKEQIKSVLANGLPSELKKMPEYKEAERKFYEENGTDESFEKSLIDDALFELERRKSNGDAYNALSVAVGDKLASKILSSLGYTGIKYPAGTIMGGVEGDEINYVIFKPEDMRITEHTKFSLRLKSAIEETETNPSDAQKESGNYKKGHIKFGGYDYTIENPKGSTRSGKDADGKEWKVTMHDTYGYIRGKFGKDGDHLDMFINDKADLDNWNGDVFVVDQVNPDGSFDEHKVMYGYDSMDDAKKAYLANYSKGWQGLGNITGASKDEFDKWLDTSNRKLKPFADYAKVKFSLKDIKPVGVGAFGNIYNQFRGNAKAAIEFLKKVRGGEAVGALHHKDIGDIDLVWGKEGTRHSDGYGLSKLVKYHPEVLDNLQEILNDMRVVSSSKNRVNLESETHKAGARLTWDGERKSWLLTAFKKETSASDKRTDTAATSLEGDTALSQTEGSAAKIDNSSETAKENGEKVDVDGTKFSLKDEEYLKAVEDGNMEKAQKMVNEAADAAGYSTDSSYQGTSAFNGAAPWGNGYFLTKEERKEAWDNGEFEGESTLGDYINDDIDGGNLEELTNAASYRAADPMRKEAIDNVHNAIQKKAKTITMYRSVPSDVKEGSFRNGDWVTPSRAYAVDNAKLHGWGDDYNIIEQKVPVDDVWFDGNDIAEWGYGREEDYINDTDFAYKNSKNNKKLLDAVTYDDNGNVIPLSQRFNEKNKDVRFSLKDEKTMFGMHNISIDKLRKAIKQGGFAAPSMGVVDSKNGIYSGYGEITLIPKAEKIDKRTGKNIGTYAADAWTPIYPHVEKKFGGNGSDVAYNDIESVPKEMQRLTRNAINSFMDGREANGLAYLYLQEKGKTPELVHVEGKYPKKLHDEVKSILGKLDGIYSTTDEQKEELLDLFIREVYDGNREEFDNDIKKFIRKDEEFIKKRPNSNIAKKKQLDVDWMKEHGYDYGALSRFVDGILRDAETSGKVDENATMKAAQQYIQDNSMNEDFDSWKEKLNDRYNVEEVIFAGYKPDGNRKYLPNTVENAVKVMKQDGKNASVGSASFSHFVASILKPMGTLDQIRKKKGNLTGNYEDVEKFQEKWQPVYDELADKMQPDAEPFESYGMDRLEEAATQKNPKKYAKDEYGVDLTDEDIDKLNELIDAVKNEKPSIYFETKFMRPYGLDEFEKAIVPNDTPSDVVDALKMAGIDVSSYERGNAEDRQKVTMDAINSSDNIRFSLKSMMAKPEGWKQANKKAIHIAEAIERDPKFSLKNLDGTLIKAGTYFSGGGLVEEGDYNYVIFDENNANIVGNTRFSLRYDKFEHDLNQWKKDNNLPKDAQRPTIPQRNAGESAVDFLRRVDEYRKQMALWKTAPTYEQHLLSDDTALGEFNRELQRGSVLKRIAFQDSMLAIRKAQEAIMKEVGVDRLNMAEDAYTAENRSHGKGKNEFEEYNNEFLQPLRKAYHQMKKILGDSYDNVRIYMMAKHGLERDAQMAFKKSLDADFEDVAQRSAAYRAYKGDMNRITNDSDLELGRVDFNTWRQRDNALRTKYSPSYMDYRYDENGIAYDYSGLSALFGGSDFEEAAHKLVRDIESSHVAEVQDLWNATNAATKKILRDGYKAGMMSKDAYQYVRDMYSHYIPLRGWDGTTADQVWDYVGGGKGAFNQTLKTAHGRTSIADDPIAYIENMAESGILLNNKNWVKQHLMLLAQNHPTSLLTLSKAWYVKSTDVNGNEEWIPATPQITSQMNSNQVKAAIDAFEQKMENMAQTGDATQQRDGLNIAYPQTHSEEREHEVRVMKDGEEYVIYVNGDPQLAQAMNNTRAHRVREIQSGKLDRAAAWLGRKMAAAYTSLSPLFIPSNYFRDLTMTLASTAIREDAKYNYLLRKNLATSWNLGFMLRDYQNGKLREKVSNGNATPKEQMFYDFMMNGGETGFVSSLDVEDLKKKFKNDLKDLDRWKANPVKVGHTIMDSIEFLNRAIEDSNRFAVYMTSMQYGRSIDEAVNDSKDVTLNFNRKGTGEYGWQMIRNLYLFINPAVQSLQTLGALVKHHPFKFTAVTASWLASGVLVPIVNAALMSMFGGDDDKDKYWQFTKWDRRNNLIMWVPFTHEYVKIPLAQEFRAFYGLGDMIASKMMGVELAEESWSQYAEDLLGQVVDMLPLDPTGYDGNIAVSLMPNPIRPIFELAFNVDFTGKPLFKDTEYNKYDPNFTKAYVGTPDWLVRASKMVNSIGNDYPDVQQNSIDAFGDPRYNLNNPAVVDHVLSSYLGGAYTMGSQVLGVLTKSLNDPKEIKVADIPLFSKFVSNPDDRPVTKKQGDEFWNMKENHDRAANTLSKLKKQAKVDGDYSMLARFYGSEDYKQYKQDDVKVKKYEEEKKKERAEESGEEYISHKLNADDIYKAHATPNDDFEDLKLKQLYTKLNGFKTAYDLLVDTAPSQSDGYYNTNKAAIDAIDEISLDKQEISELKKGFLDDGKDAYNAEDMKQIRDLRKKILAVLENANKVVVANQKAKAEK